ncbi:uncharacterized protein C8Q71DRAFT_796909 [Rhodofomes roseus]|uniref:protein-tyrosine-phosphatase n=1 Tax=Rhodofomes roseus TaxID=34475 RepID=A0ABQ8KG72_9APHY|nr:uncharacterized protein C8Q71DRAFT_796909 [Rhodofomes roseus]KAH9836776.1 hypothetical protein C8Q71DRAFT_796909 [Rhodofomes roseus]
MPQPLSAGSSSLSSASSPPLASPETASAFPALGPADLLEALADPTALIVDIRPFNAYATARIRGSLSLSVPSTLLKRPTYALARLAPMISSTSARARFATWRDSSRIIVHDADAGGLLERPALLGLLRKFRAEGFDERRQVAWIKGGFNSVWRERPDLLDHSPLPEEAEEEDDVAELAPPSMAITDNASVHALPEMAKSSSAPATTATFKALRTKALPMSAFTRLEPSASRGAGPSLLAARASKSHNPMDPQATPSAFNLRLPAFSSAPGTVRAQTAQTTHPFPPVAGTSIMPTLSASSASPVAFSTTVGGMRPHRHSVPHGRPVAFNAFFDAIRQNLELAHRTEPAGEGGRGAGIALRLPRRVRRRVGDLPFDWLREIARRSGRASESSSESESEEEEEGSQQDGVTFPAPRETRPGPPAAPTKRKPTPLADDAADSADEDAMSVSSQSPPSAEDLARELELQFYRIELGEQRRLMGVMEHHSLESQPGTGDVGAGAAGVVPVVSGDPGEKAMEEEDFPFSITAGLEKGNKNRYRNIWPFEHARVRLRKARPDDDDYMNASYVQPLGTKKRYIATQGPLAATYNDFWTLCWEQNVHVIVMLTREIEGNTVKCGKYWTEGEYGPLRLQLLATDDTPERERRRREKETNGGFFSAHVPPPPKSTRKSRRQQKAGSDSDSERDIVRRVFKLTHTGYPQAKPRVVTQLQYLAWPDFNVPEDPRGLLGLIREVEEAAARSHKAGDKTWGEGPMHPGPWPSRMSIPTPSPPKEHAQPADVPLDDNDVDPLTGVSRRVVDNPPVLLHCSAGVGRTGGYIAVDALRTQKEQVRASPDRMDVDTSPSAESPSASGEGAGKSRSRASPPVPELTVHVRVAGFTESMDVDGERKREPGASSGKGKPARKEVPRTVVPASSELVNEVRRATMLRWPSVSTSTSGDTAPVAGKDWESSSSESSQIPSRPTTLSATLSGESSAPSRSCHSSASPPSSHTGSSTSLSAAMAKQTAHMSLSQKEKAEREGSTLPRDVDHQLRPTEHARHSQRQSDVETHASRLDTWRSEVRPSDSPPSAAVSRSSKSPDTTVATGGQADAEGTGQGESSQYQRGRAFDFAHPRRLHTDLSPPLVSTYDEPIRRVIEDMREQRMSLCQSLRQYVFVYRAVIEGTLMIIDQEREKEELARSSLEAAQEAKPSRGRVPDRQDVDMEGLMYSPETVPSASAGALRERGMARTRKISDYMREDAAIDGHHLAMSPGGMKRGASPTELPKEDVQGEAMLTKRPSIKRTARMDIV